MPSVKVQPMASVEILPLGNYPSGSWTSPAVDVGDAVTRIDFSIQACTTATPAIWPNASTTLDVVPEVSFDGGATWQENAPTRGMSGGIHVFKGHELAFLPCGGSLAPGTGRKYRINTVIVNGPLRSAMTLEVT